MYACIIFKPWQFLFDSDIFYLQIETHQPSQSEYIISLRTRFQQRQEVLFWPLSTLAKCVFQETGIWIYFRKTLSKFSKIYCFKNLPARVRFKIAVPEFHNMMYSSAPFGAVRNSSLYILRSKPLICSPNYYWQREVDYVHTSSGAQFLYSIASKYVFGTTFLPFRLDPSLVAFYLLWKYFIRFFMLDLVQSEIYTSLNMYNAAGLAQFLKKVKTKPNSFYKFDYRVRNGLTEQMERTILSLF